MEKEEILKQAQSEKNAEYENAIMYKAQFRSIIAVSVICVIIFIIKAFVSDLRGLEKVLPFYDILAIMFGNVAVSYFYLYRKLHESKYIVIGIGGCILFAMSILKFITTI